MELHCIGRHLGNTSLEVRELLSLSDSDIAAFLPRLRLEHELPECLLISTCNRTELYFSGCSYWHTERALEGLSRLFPQAPWTQENSQVLCGQDAVRHVFRLAAGLESQVLGENEILGQLKDAYQLACQAKTNGAITNEIFHRAFRVGKRVRADTHLCAGGTSVGTVAVIRAEKEIGSLAGLSVLVVGAGDIAALAARTAAGKKPKDLTVANRNRERAAQITAKTGGQAVGLEELPEALKKCDLVFSSTASTDYVITPGMIPAGRERPLNLYDLAIPRDIDPAVAGEPCVRLRNLDDVKPLVNATFASRLLEVPKAETIVEAEVASYNTWLRELAAVPSIRRLLDIGEQTLQAELEAMRDRLPAKDFDIVEQASRRINQKLMREIIAELKNTARKAGAYTAESAYYPPESLR